MSGNNEVNHLREMATEIVAQCWCAEKTKHISMDPVLAEEFTSRLTGWLETLAQAERNTDFYRGLLDACAKHIGKTAYMADDGVVHDSPLRIGIPRLVRSLVRTASVSAAYDVVVDMVDKSLSVGMSGERGGFVVLTIEEHRRQKDANVLRGMEKEKADILRYHSRKDGSFISGFCSNETMNNAHRSL